jgi:hypothetical protein
LINAFFSLRALDIRQQPIPSPNFVDSHGQYAGNALVGQSPTAHWQMDVDGDEQESSLSMKSDLYFLTATLDVPSLPIRQVTQYFVEEDYLGMLIMDLTATSIIKPPSEVQKTSFLTTSFIYSPIYNLGFPTS